MGWVVVLVVANLLGCGAPGGARGVSDGLQVGQPVPGLSLMGLDGQVRTLAEAQGQIVVVEWLVPDCAYVTDVHGPGGALRDLVGTEGVQWWGVLSGVHPEAAREAAGAWAFPFPLLMDPTFEVADAWGASSAPHVFVIDQAGVLRYRGAVDNQPLREQPGDRVPYAEQALRAVQQGVDPAVPRTRPYGCRIR